MSAPAPDPHNPDSNQPPKSEDTTSPTPAVPTVTDDDVQMKDEPDKAAEEEVKEPVDTYEDIPDHVMSVSLLVE